MRQPLEAAGSMGIHHGLQLVAPLALVGLRSVLGIALDETATAARR